MHIISMQNAGRAMTQRLLLRKGQLPSCCMRECEWGQAGMGRRADSAEGSDIVILPLRP